MVTPVVPHPIKLSKMDGVVVTPTSPHLGVSDEGGAAPSLPLFVTSLSLFLSSLYPLLS